MDKKEINIGILSSRRQSSHSSRSEIAQYLDGKIDGSFGWTYCPRWVGAATPYELGRSGDRIPVEAKFSASVQTGRGGPPSLLYVGY